MSDEKRTIYHSFKNDIIKLQTILELFLFEDEGVVSKQEMLRDGEQTLLHLVRQWEGLKKFSCNSETSRPVNW
jgi:hypothetical protein